MTTRMPSRVYQQLKCWEPWVAGGTLLTLVAPFVNIQFLGSSLTFMMVRGKSTAMFRLLLNMHAALLHDP